MMSISIKTLETVVSFSEDSFVIQIKGTKNMYSSFDSLIPNKTKTCLNNYLALNSYCI